ncbi:MAG: adenylate/guanylate cyclase domain-containing protein [Candidatus Tumulicola sp.]
MPVGALPTGTVTLLFSDIEGSTQHWQQRREAMALALRRHDDLVRTAIEAHGGYVFKTVGDAFCAAFWRAPDAVAAALDAQRALIAEDFSAVGGLCVRMALHSGTADERDGDYFGPAPNRVARLLAVVHGSQVVVSGATAQLLRGVMPEKIELLDLGEHRLKDLVEPEEIWQLLAPGLPETFPPLRSLGSLPNNLPRQVTALIGRDEVVLEIEALVGKFPLVTLVGTGGVGKSRVALQVGAELLDGSSGGVWFVELAPLNDPALVAATIASALGLTQKPDHPMLDSLLHYLQRKHLLLILDNCEHVVENVAEIAEAVLRDCPQVQLLATSREPLRIAGEHAYRMPSLAVPAEMTTLTAEDALGYGAVALFAERAAAADTRFRLTDESAPIVAEICRRLDGIALAIELAAARVKVLAPRQLAQKLDERFRVLTGGSRAALPRQQTLRALIDWSYDVLSEQERTLFRRLAVFAGGFTLDFAAAVCTSEAIAGFEIFDLLASLVDKSLVVANAEGDKTRFRFLESMRAYASEKLVEHGEFEPTARAHANAYLSLAEDLEAAYDTTPDATWKIRAEPELENWRAALRWAFEAHGDLNIAQGLAAALLPVWFTMAPSEGLGWVQTGLEGVHAETPTREIARLELSAAHLFMLAQRYKNALSGAERALEGFTELGDRHGIALAHMFTGAARGFLGETVQGEARLRTALEEFRQLGARRAIGAALVYLATLQLSAGDVATSRGLFADALEVWKSIGAARPSAHLALSLAELEFQAGDAEAAVRLVSEALETERALNDVDSVAFDLCNLAAYLVSLCRWAEARSRAREALELARERQIGAAAVWAIQHLAAVAALQPSTDVAKTIDNRRRAARLVGFVDSRIAEFEMRRDFTEHTEYARLLSAIEDALGAEAAALMEEGRNWTAAHADAEALSV